MLTVGETVQDRYVIEKVIKEGGMGAVFLAHDNRLEGPCALKEMLETNDAWVGRRFREEATLLSRIKHPDVPAVRDFFQVGHLRYIVMDFVPGQNLSDEMHAARDRGARGLASAELREIALSLLAILEYLHGLQPPLLHCDIKPGNIIREIGTGRLKLVDFGLARAPGENTHTVAGTLQYCAPEQLMGHAETRSDLYGLAATLYFLAGGELALMGAPRPILMVVPDLDLGLANMIDATLKADPTQRPLTAAAMRAFLLPPEAPTPVARPSNPGKKTPWALGLLIVAAIGFGGYHSRHLATPTPLPSPSTAASEPHLTELTQTPTLGLRKKVPLDQLQTAYGALLGPVKTYAVKAGLNPVHTYCRWYDSSDPKVVDMEMGVTLEKPAPSGDGIEAGELPAGRAVTLTHTGPYTGVWPAYQKLHSWAILNRRKSAPQAWALYLIENPAEPVTEVTLPLVD